MRCMELERVEWCDLELSWDVWQCVGLTWVGWDGVLGEVL